MGGTQELSPPPRKGGRMEDYASFEETEGGRYESGRSQLSHKSYTLLHGRGDKKSRFRDATSLLPTTF